jgi:hypothetical protein
MEGKEAAKVCRQAAATLTQAMNTTKELGSLYMLAKILNAVADRMEAKEAVVFCGQGATILIQAMRSTPTDQVLLDLAARELSALASLMEPKEAAAALIQAIKTAASERGEVLVALAKGMSALEGRLKPEQAAECAAALIQAMRTNKGPYELCNLTEALSAMAGQMEPKEAAAVCAQAAAALIHVMSTTNERGYLNDLTNALSGVLLREHPARFAQRNRMVAEMVAHLGGTGLTWTAPALLAPRLETLPPPLPAQMLVNLLKHPLCVGEARRLVLEQLSRHYHLPFADQWEFVEYAHQHRLELDLTPPPQKPER